jgi:hypothetical protein
MFAAEIKCALALVLLVGLARGPIRLGVGFGTTLDEKEKPELPDNNRFEQVVWVRNKAPQVSARTSTRSRPDLASTS